MLFNTRPTTTLGRPVGLHTRKMYAGNMSIASTGRTSKVNDDFGNSSFNKYEEAAFDDSQGLAKSVIHAPKQAQEDINFLTDRKLVKSQVYHSRLCSEASKIQALVRGAMQLRRFRKTVLNIKATKIQAAARSWFARLQVRLVLLQKKLVTGAQLHKQALKKIEQNKKRDMAQILKQYQQEYATVDHQATIDRANEIVALLRDENKMLRKKNDKLRRAVAELMKENSLLKRQAHVFSIDTPVVKENIKILEAERVEWKKVIYLYQDRKGHFENLMEDRESSIIAEGKITEKVRGSIDIVKELVQREPCDEELVDEIAEIIATPQADL